MNCSDNMVSNYLISTSNASNNKSSTHLFNTHLMSDHNFLPENDNLNDPYPVQDTIMVKPIDSSLRNTCHGEETHIPTNDLVTIPNVSFVQVHENNEKKHPTQVLFKLLDDDSINLDMVDMMSEEGIEHCQVDNNTYNLLSKQSLSTKQSNLENVKDSVDISVELNNFSIENKNIESCNIVWSCNYCSLTFKTEKESLEHQEKELKHMLKTNQTTNILDNKITDKSKKHELLWESDVKIKNDLNNWALIWTCSICNKKFIQSEKLNQHLLTHSIRELASALIQTITPEYNSIKNIEYSNDNHTSNQDYYKVYDNEFKLNKGKEIQKEDIVTNVVISQEQDLSNNTNINVNNPTDIISIISDPSCDDNNDLELNSTSIESAKLRKCKKNQNTLKSRDPHTCPTCNKVLCSRGNLKKHMVVHAFQKPWMCTICNVGYNTKRNYLHHHMSKHTTERPYSCKLCGKSYVSKIDLKLHEINHNPASLTCDQCNKSFSSLKCMRRHQKRHNKVKQFVCPICSRAFTVQDDMSSHIRKVHQKQGKKSIKSSVKAKKVNVLDGSIDRAYINNYNTQKSLSPHNKEKVFSEFYPVNESSQIMSQQLIPSYLTSENISEPIASKDQIILNKNFLTIIPINQEKECSYGVTLTNDSDIITDPIPDSNTDTYVMISNSEQDITDTSNLSIMYSSTSLDQVCHVVKNGIINSIEDPSDMKLNGLNSEQSNQEEIGNSCMNHSIQSSVLNEDCLPLNSTIDTAIGLAPNNLETSTDSQEKNLELAADSPGLPLELLSHLDQSHSQSSGSVFYRKKIG